MEEDRAHLRVISDETKHIDWTNAMNAMNMHLRPHISNVHEIVWLADQRGFVVRRLQQLCIESLSIVKGWTSGSMCEVNSWRCEQKLESVAV